MLSHILEAAKHAERCNYRHLIVLAEERDEGIAHLKKIIASVPYERKIVFTWKKDFSVDGEIDELKNSEKYLGSTYDFLAIDFHHSFVPNDLGKLVNIVRGGGLLIFLTPELEKWKKSTNYFHESILTPPYSLEDIRHNFIPWVIKNLLNHEGISIYSNEEWIKKDIVNCEKREEKVDDSFLPAELRGMAKTQDQARVIGKIIGDKRKIKILTADRGRGKSSALGISIAYLIASGKLRRVGVTAPEYENLGEFFKFLRIGLDKFGVKYAVKKKRIEGKRFFVEFETSPSISPKKYDMLVVDEAAGIPVPLLLSMARARNVIYSTTVHGYEGTGRAFAIRFLGELRKREKKILEMEMKAPIRYAPDDSMEKWLFDTLLLDSEPADIEKVDTKKLEYKKYRIEDLLRNEEKLREYYGIFVLAHYRNNPNDFGIICDAPNQEIRTLEYDGHVVCSVQIAREGRIEDFAEEMYYGYTPPGNIVPDVMLKHYKNREFAKLSGLRIVRIATHPKFMNMGIGSLMLSKITQEDYDWFGSSFGATPQLLNFWTKNGFFPIHISPRMNEKTGEYSVVVLKWPHSKEIRRELGKRLVLSLGDVHSSMDPELARVILWSIPKKGKVKLDDLDWHRLISYAWGPGNYEVTMDVIYRIAQQYFFAKKVPKLNEEQEKILIAKVLQHRSWKDAGREINRGDVYVVIELREIMRKFIGSEYDDEVSEFQRRFHGED